MPDDLGTWVNSACGELGLDGADIDRDLILGIARDVAHAIARPAAPLTTYMIGLAVGQGQPAHDVAARITALAHEWPGESA